MGKWSKIFGRVFNFVTTFGGLVPTSIVQTFVWPILWMAAVSGVGIAQHIQWMWVMVAASLALSSGLGVAIRWSEWRFNRQVEHRLSLGPLRIGKRPKMKGKPQALCLGVTLNSDALFPIRYSIVSIRTAVGAIQPKEKPNFREEIEIPIRGVGWFDDSFIEVPSPPKDETTEATLEFEIKYGKPGDLRYTMKDRKRVHIYFNARGEPEHGNFYDQA